MATDETYSALKALARKLKSLRDQAEAAGLFTHDRELLTCPTCGLQEDVTVHGELITHEADRPDGSDLELRFHESSDGQFVCPRCNTCIIDDATNAPRATR